MPSLKSEWNPFLKAERPNIRSMFCPDPGYILIECDLKQSDAQVVAWEAGDEELIEIFTRMNNGEDIDVHAENAKVCFNLTSIAKWQRQLAKHVVHGTNFTGSSYEIARRLGMLRHQVDTFQKRWFGRHPRIREWHRKVESDLTATRCVRNILGYRRMYFERVDQILPEAVAWIAQSTTALVINAGIRAVRRAKLGTQFLIQVHDSGVWQVPVVLYSDALKSQMKKCLSIELPYKPRPLTIGVDMKASNINWGEAEKVPWNTTETILAQPCNKINFEVLRLEQELVQSKQLPPSVSASTVRWLALEPPRP